MCNVSPPCSQVGDWWYEEQKKLPVDGEVERSFNDLLPPMDADAIKILAAKAQTVSKKFFFIRNPFVDFCLEETVRSHLRYALKIMCYWDRDEFGARLIFDDDPGFRMDYSEEEVRAMFTKFLPDGKQYKFNVEVKYTLSPKKELMFVLIIEKNADTISL